MGMREDFREMGIHNQHEFVKYARTRGVGPAVYIGYRAAQGGRVTISAAWQIEHVEGKKTEDKPNAFWMDYGKKTFNVYDPANRDKLLDEARAFATARYGVTEWVKGPGGIGGTFYVARETYDLVMGALKAARKAAGPQTPKAKVFGVELRSSFVSNEIGEALGLDRWVRQADIYVSAPSRKAALEVLAAAGFEQSAGHLQISEGFVTEALRDAGVYDGTPKVIVMAASGNRGNGNVLEVRGRDDFAVIGAVEGYSRETTFTPARAER